MVKSLSLRPWNDGVRSQDGDSRLELHLAHVFVSLFQSKDAGDSDSEKEQEQLGEIENVLKKHDPNFQM